MGRGRRRWSHKWRNSSTADLRQWKAQAPTHHTRGKGRNGARRASGQRGQPLRTRGRDQGDRTDNGQRSNDQSNQDS